MFWKKYFSTKNLLLIYDGSHIIAQICDAQTIYGNTTFPLSKNLNEILSDAKAKGCSNLWVFKLADMREIEVKLGTTLDAEERASAIEYAARAHYGEQAENLAMNCLDGMFHDFHSGILISSFDLNEVTLFATAAQQNGLRFKGLVSLQQLLTATHFSSADSHNHAMLILFENQGFVASYDKSKLIVRNLPFGTPPEILDEDWKEKIARRLALLKHKDVILYAQNEHEALSDYLISTVDANSIRFESINDGILNASLFLNQKGTQLIRPAHLPPKPKDPKAPGTYIALFMTGMTLVSMGFLGIQNHFTKETLTERLTQNEAMEKQVKNEEASLKRTEDATRSEQAIHEILIKSERVNKRLLFVVNLLERYHLQYTKINGISEENKGIVIDGETIWQPDLSGFFAHFSKELEKYKLSLFSEGLTLEKEGRITFKARISEGGK